jgi:hypothetical protein
MARLLRKRRATSEPEQQRSGIALEPLLEAWALVWAPASVELSEFRHAELEEAWAAELRPPSEAGVVGEAAPARPEPEAAEVFPEAEAAQRPVAAAPAWGAAVAP